MCVDIGSFDSPVAKQFGVRSIPRFHIYDANGTFAVEGGQAAIEWLRRHCEGR